MACLKLTVFVPVKVMTMTILMSVLFLLAIKTGFAMKQAGTCRPFCTGSDCITVNQERVDFKTAEEACRDRNGELVTFQPETDENIFDLLSQEFNGNLWIGLRLPSGACSNLSAPLRGYEWTSGGIHRSFVPSFSTWKDGIKVCSPRCVSLSHDQKWTERLCSDKIDGFLCKTKHKDACQVQELSDPTVFQSSKGCSTAPCEHTCTEVKEGYKCSCFKGYIPDSKDPRQCKMKIHCAQQKCPEMCEGGSCYCPNGYIHSESFCEDIDECFSKQCDQDCKNTFGSFVCSCKKGFVLEDEVRCIEAADGESSADTPRVVGFVKPAADNNTVKGSSAPAGGLIWIWIFVAVAVGVFIVVIRFYVVKRQKRREQNSNQQSTVPVDNVEC